MYTLLKPLEVRDTLLRTGLSVFTPYDFERLFQIRPERAKYFLEKEAHDGMLVRLKQGLYSLKTDLPTEEEIANKLYQPSYISFEYALAHYSILPEMTYTITCATTKPTRLFTVGSKSFSYLTIKQEAYTGYHMVKRNGKTFLIAEPEKAVVDYLYFVALGKKTFNDRLVTTSLNKEKLMQYARLYARDKVSLLLQTV